MHNNRSETGGMDRRTALQLIAAGFLSTPELPAQGQKVIESITPKEAADYINLTLNPGLSRYLHSESSAKLPGITNRLVEQFKLTVPAGAMKYVAVGGYSPGAKDMVAHIDYDTPTNRPVLMVFVPAMKDFVTQLEQQKFSRAEIDLCIAIVFAHEQIHYPQIKNMVAAHGRDFLNYHNQPEIVAKDEAEAWGITIIDMIRPAMRQGFRLPVSMIHNSDELKKVNDNYYDPAWKQAFMPKK